MRTISGTTLHGSKFSLRVAKSLAFTTTFPHSSMIKISRLSLRLSLCASAVALGGVFAGTACAQTNVILNSGFEAGGYTSNGTGEPATLQDGNNIGAVPNFWTVDAAYTASNSNLQQGSNTNQGIVLPVYSGVYSGGSDGSVDGTHFWDGTTPDTSPVTLTQSFTLTSTSDLSGTFALGGRDPGAAAANTTITITGGPAGVFTPFTSANFSTTEGAWQVQNFSLSAVPAGTYLFSVNLAEQHNIDAVALIAVPVPEPSTCALMFGGGALAVGVLRRRKTTGF